MSLFSRRPTCLLYALVRSRLDHLLQSANSSMATSGRRRACSSECNIADGLSRDGVQDGWTLKQGWKLMEVSAPPWSGVSETPLSTMLRAQVKRARSMYLANTDEVDF